MPPTAWTIIYLPGSGPYSSKLLVHYGLHDNLFRSFWLESGPVIFFAPLKLKWAQCKQKSGHSNKHYYTTTLTALQNSSSQSSGFYTVRPSSSAAVVVVALLPQDGRAVNGAFPSHSTVEVVCRTFCPMRGSLLQWRQSKDCNCRLLKQRFVCLFILLISSSTMANLEIQYCNKN